MAAKEIKTRLVPYRILAQLLYSTASYILSREQNKIIIKHGYMSRANKLNLLRFFSALQYLVMLDLIKSFEPSGKRGQTIIIIKQPLI